MERTTAMNKKEIAVNYHIQGFNCSQAVIGAFCEELGLEKDIAMQVASGFGGGMRCGSTCGAVTGALMALGIKYGQTKAEDQETKMKMYSRSTEFQNRFKALHDTTICKELLGHDISSPEGFAVIQQKGLSRSLCDKLISDAVELVDEMLKENK